MKWLVKFIMWLLGVCGYSCIFRKHKHKLATLASTEKF
jgi:hypothetical protein